MQTADVRHSFNGFRAGAHVPTDLLSCFLAIRKNDDLSNKIGILQERQEGNTAPPKRILMGHSLGAACATAELLKAGLRVRRQPLPAIK